MRQNLFVVVLALAFVSASACGAKNPNGPSTNNPPPTQQPSPTTVIKAAQVNSTICAGSPASGSQGCSLLPVVSQAADGTYPVPSASFTYDIRVPNNRGEGRVIVVKFESSILAGWEREFSETAGPGDFMPFSGTLPVPAQGGWAKFTIREKGGNLAAPSEDIVMQYDVKRM